MSRFPCDRSRSNGIVVENGSKSNLCGFGRVGLFKSFPCRSPFVGRDMETLVFEMPLQETQFDFTISKAIGMIVGDVFQGFVGILSAQVLNHGSCIVQARVFLSGRLNDCACERIEIP